MAVFHTFAGKKTEAVSIPLPEAVTGDMLEVYPDKAGSFNIRGNMLSYAAAGEWEAGEVLIDKR